MRSTSGATRILPKRDRREQPFLIGLTPSQIKALPTSGAAYTNVLGRANDTITVDMGTTGIGSAAACRAFAAGLIYIRSGTESYREKVVTALDTVRNWNYGANGDYQSYYRQAQGWILAADLIGYRSQAFLDFVETMTDYTSWSAPPGRAAWNSLYKCSWDAAINHGAVARASFQASALYLGDTGRFAESGRWMRCFWGDRSDWMTWNNSTAVYGGFSTDGQYDPYQITWMHFPTAWVPVNPVEGDATRDGCIVVEVTRDNTSYSLNGSNQPVWGLSGNQYLWTSLHGALVSTLLMEKNGYPDVWSWSDSAPKRAVDYIYLWDNNWQAPPSAHQFSITKWMDSLINRKYGTSWPEAAGTAYGLCFTDWLPV